MISAVLLAAGQSRRMGEFKQLLPLGEKSFVEHCVDNLLASRAGEVIVVTGHRSAEVRAALAGRAVRFAHNENHLSGMGASIKRGVEAVSPDAEAMMIALADQPLIGSGVFDHLMLAYEKDHPLITIPTYGGKRGHPIILDSKLREDILTMDLAEGLRQVTGAHKDEILYVEVSSEEVLLDFDLPQDYRRLISFRSKSCID
jgi:molybdenum cofactor cytidylyltransferase